MLAHVGLFALSAAMSVQSPDGGVTITVEPSTVGGNNRRNGDHGPYALKNYKEGEQAFTTLPDSKVVEVPEHLLGQPMVIYSYHNVPLYLTFNCMAAEGCEVLFHLYDCPGCRHLEGGVKEALANEGFERIYCSMRFTVRGADGFRHRMATYMKRLEKDEFYVMQLPEHEFSVTGSTVQKGCEAIQNPGQCRATPPHGEVSCVWQEDAARCKTRRCPRPAGPFGQGPSCKVCPLDELP